MKNKIILSPFIIILGVALFGCATPTEIQEARDTQYSLVSHLYDNSTIIINESVALYKKQATEDIEFIYEALKDEDPEKASKIKIEKLAIIEKNIKKIKAALEKNKLNFEQYKKIQEALK